MRSNLRIKSTSQLPPAGDSEAFKELESSRRRLNGNYCSKENVEVNKCESLKLAVEPQQMKRKKKGREYNLRKSLAWDRAFFTEEGVLDPLELSIITGAFQREEQSFIHEDSPGSSMLLIHGNQVKGAKNGSVDKSRKKDYPSPSLPSLSRSIITSPPASSHGISTHSASKSVLQMNYCSRLPPPSSLKRPSNLTGKGACKESKLPKFPTPMNPGLDAIAASRRSSVLRTNHVKHNQFIKSVASNSDVTSLGSNCCPNDQSSSLQRLGRKVENPSSKMTTEYMPPSRSISTIEGKDELAASVIPLKAQDSSKVMNPLPSQSLKPSGLRMPSPSLSVFSQPKKCTFSPKETETIVYGPKKPQVLMMPEMGVCSEKKRSNTSVSNGRPYTGAESGHVLDSRIHSSLKISRDWKDRYNSGTLLTHKKEADLIDDSHAETYKSQMNVDVTRESPSEQNAFEDGRRPFGEGADLDSLDIESSNKDSRSVYDKRYLWRSDSNVSLPDSNKPAGETHDQNSVCPSANLGGHDITGLIPGTRNETECLGGKSGVEYICTEVLKDYKNCADEACKEDQNATEICRGESGVEDICAEVQKDHQNDADEAVKDDQNATDFFGESGVEDICPEVVLKEHLNAADEAGKDYQNVTEFCGGELGVDITCPDVGKEYQDASDEACTDNELVKLKDSVNVEKPECLSNNLHEKCDHSATCDAETVSPKVEISQDSISVEETLAVKNKQRGDSPEKVKTYVDPRNAIPFSEEWLAAIEAAGEDILTRKGVQLKIHLQINL